MPHLMTTTDKNVVLTDYQGAKFFSCGSFNANTLTQSIHCRVSGCAKMYLIIQMLEYSGQENPD
jgi:hypothetical protein